jgi:hypothetical protein
MRIVILAGGFVTGEAASLRSGTRSGGECAGGAMGFADPEMQIGDGYLASKMVTRISGDPRDVALRAAIHAACACETSSAGDSSSSSR